MDCPSAVQVLSRSPVTPWMKQMSTVALGQSCRIFTPSGKQGAGGVLDGLDSVSVCGCELERLVTGPVTCGGLGPGRPCLRRCQSLRIFLSMPFNQLGRRA